LHSRVTLIWSTGQFDGQVADVYNVNTDVPFITSPFGAHGSFHTPQDDDNGAFIHLYDRLAFNFYPPSGHNDIDPLGTPWSLKISDNPVTAPGAVPEPATWALMIAGFGLVGAALRRRPVLAA